jgi:uncharacterized protein (TIGR00290 family)
MSKVNRLKVVVSWSSGKDCAFALHQVLSQGRHEVVGLLTTLNQENDRIAMHGVRKDLLLMQMAALGLSAEMVMLPSPCDNQTYLERMGCCMERLRERGVRQVVFGDLFLEDIRQYREGQMQGSGIDPVFPLWQRETGQLARDMLASGLRAVVTCIDRRVLPAGFAGRWYDEAFLADLPAGVDPCGENGEFHTLVTAGPMFSRPIAVQLGKTVTRGDFVYVDVLPVRA